MIYVCDDFSHTAVPPETVPGCTGPLMVTFNVWAAPDPQVLLAVTKIVPPTEPAVAFIDVVVETPLHPVGRVQV